MKNERTLKLALALGAVVILNFSLAAQGPDRQEEATKKERQELEGAWVGTFVITWTTTTPTTSQVEFEGQDGAFTNSTYVTSHSMSLRGPKGGSVDYYVSSTDVYGDTVTEGPFTHQN